MKWPPTGELPRLSACPIPQAPGEPVSDGWRILAGATDRRSSELSRKAMRPRPYGGSGCWNDELTKGCRGPGDWLRVCGPLPPIGSKGTVGSAE